MRRRYGWHDAGAAERMQPLHARADRSLPRCRADPTQRACRPHDLVAGRAALAGAAPRETMPAITTDVEWPARVTGQPAGDAADRVSRQRQNDAAAPRSDRARVFRHRRHHQRDRRDRDRPLPCRFRRGQVLELPGGCLCCAVREDLAKTLRDLIDKRDAGEVRAFRRIVVETSGLADPAPILFTLGTDPMLDQRLRLARVVTLVDAVTGADSLQRFAEAARQAAVADALVISKTDLAPFGADLAAVSTRSTPAPSASSAPPRAIRRRCCSAPNPHLNPPPRAGEGATRAAAALPRLRGSDGRERRMQPPTRTASTPSRVILDGAISRFDFARALGRAGAGPRQRSVAGQGPGPLRRPAGPAGRRAGGAARDVHAGMARRLAGRGHPQPARLHRARHPARRNPRPLRLREPSLLHQDPGEGRDHSSMHAS